MLTKLLLAAVVAVAGCSLPATFYTETDTEIRLTYGGGGFLDEKRRLYEPLYIKCRSEKQCIIDGVMISADAFYAFGLPGVCYTPRAVWAPHAVSADSRYRLANETANITLYLPDPLAEHFRASPYYWNFLTVRDIGYAELLTIWPDGACDGPD